VSGARVALLVLVFAALGCERKGEEAAPPSPTLPPAAAEQIVRACAAYVAHACACAAADPADAALAEQCSLARALPSALELAIAAAEQPRASRRDAEGLLANVGKIQKNCVEESARLELRCPRPAAPPR
jgi:hypothetical protein